MDWRLLTFIVCSFGFFKDLRPSEAYLTAYLTGPWKNLTSEQVNNEIYPWWTYSYLLWLVPVFLLTDFLRFKPILILDGIAFVSTLALLLWAQGVPAMKLMQVTFGLATAGEISYMSYLYAIVSKDRYMQVATFTRAASQIGSFVAYLFAQLILQYQVLNIFQLNIVSMVSVSIALVISLILPRAQHSELFHAKPSQTDNSPESTSDQNESEDSQSKLCTRVSLNSFRRLAKFLIAEIKSVYASKVVMTWSLWWALASCGNFQVANYIQNIWKAVAPDKSNRHLYNGAVGAAGTLLSAISVLLVGFLPLNWSRRGAAELLMALVCGMNAVLLVIIGRTNEIWIAYVFYDLFRATYQVVVTIATAQIARHLDRERYGFVFGCNTFMALLIETILTAIVVDKAGLGVDVRTQFIIYGGYFFVMATLFGGMAGLSVYRYGCKGPDRPSNAEGQEQFELREK